MELHTLNDIENKLFNEIPYPVTNFKLSSGPTSSDLNKKSNHSAEETPHIKFDNFSSISKLVLEIM